MGRTWLRWLPAVVVPMVVAGVALAGPSDAAVDLPAKTPAQVLAMVASSTVRAFSGDVEQTSSLGLPQLPEARQSGSTSASSVLAMLTGDHTARMFVDGATRGRLQVMGQLSEQDVVRSGTDAWVYSSADNTATHVTLSSRTDPAHPGSSDGRAPTDLLPGAAVSPDELAAMLLAAIDPTTGVTVEPAVRVAGRTAYDLVLTPRPSGTLVGSVSIAVDSATGLPLRVQVRARGQSTPAFSVAFTSLSLATPSADLFVFTPPPGATVREGAPEPQDGTTSTAGRPASAASVTGTGWEAVVEVPAADVPANLLTSPLLTEMTQSVPGGRLLHSALVNLLLTPDGRVLAGAVDADRLQAVAEGQ